jgi:hypothetical protein
VARTDGAPQKFWEAADAERPVAGRCFEPARDVVHGQGGDRILDEFHESAPRGCAVGKQPAGLSEAERAPVIAGDDRVELVIRPGARSPDRCHLASVQDIADGAEE